jgi:hypothetical protein
MLVFGWLSIYIFISLYPLAQSAKGEESVSDLYNLHFLTKFQTYLSRFENRAKKIHSYQRPWRMVNYQGKFGGMHKFRWEIIIEGSNDRIEWKEYKFKYKCNAGIPWGSDRPAFCPLHLPRLDWRIWFLPLAAHRDPPAWFYEILRGISEGRIPVLHLFHEIPFPASSPPTYVRSRVLDFDFAPVDSPLWWRVSEVPRHSASPLFLEISKKPTINNVFLENEEDDEEGNEEDNFEEEEEKEEEVDDSD